MIITGLLNLLYVFIFALLAPLPRVDSLPSDLNNAIDFILDTLGSWQTVIPIFDTVFAMLILVLSIEAIIYSIIGINWVINKVRGSG